ncbi:universal stress protein [Glutamicibacter arilaitensis]|uniref:universal stress protein n=1 Tax=Glutamicibacter arilaitensis TaxID=256701 RepID=UPI003851002B
MTVVVGYLPTPQGEAALDQAINEAQRAQAKLVVVNSSKGDALVDDRLIDAREFHLLEERLTLSGLDFWIERSAQGQDAADEVLRVAQAQRANLIVIGLRKRTTVGKFIMGSTAQRILMQAGCPVLTVKADATW